MNSRALTIGALVLALLGAAGLLLSQQSEIRRLAAEVAELRTQVGQMASLQDSNRQLAEKLKTAAEASQANQSELLRLRGTGSRLRQLEQENAKLQAQRQELNRRLSAAQEAAPLSPQQGQAAHVTTPPRQVRPTWVWSSLRTASRRVSTLAEEQTASSRREVCPTATSQWSKD
jgi:DNA repair exonuclease SbcCD ATPase subunit